MSGPQLQRRTLFFFALILALASGCVYHTEGIVLQVRIASTISYFISTYMLGFYAGDWE